MKVGIIGLGYVGLPLAVAFAEAGHEVVGPVDPFYLAFKAREHDFYTEFIELAGKINQNQPQFCVRKIERHAERGRKARRLGLRSADLHDELTVRL